jgi:VWFA-related protein
MLRVITASLSVLLFCHGQAVIRVNTRLVQVNVLAHDKNGAVSDLTKDDFKIFDRGKERQISVFSMDSSKTKHKAAQPLPPNIFSNKLEYRSGAPTTATVVLFDALNTEQADQMYARQQVIRFLKQVNPQDRVALYSLSSSLKILNDFTDDPAVLEKALTKYRGVAGNAVTSSEPEAANTGNNDLDQFLDDSNQRVADFANIDRALRTLQALEAIAGHIGGLPGRKNLIWISGGFPLMVGFDDPSAFGNPARETRVFTDESRQATRALNNANIAVYPVDARGLVAQPASLSASATPRKMNAPQPSTIPKYIETMQEVANATGGRAFFNTNDLAGAVGKALDDSAVTYTLGFYADNDALDGKFHDIKVQVERKGVNVRYRKGYVAFKEEAPTEKQKEVELQTALWSPIESSGLSIAARFDRVSQPEPNALRVIVSVDLHDFQLTQTAGRWNGKLEVILQQQDKDSNVLANVRQAATLSLENKNYEAYLKSGMTMAQTILPKPGLATVRVVIQDAVTGTFGSLIVPVSKVK